MSDLGDVADMYAGTRDGNMCDCTGVTCPHHEEIGCCSETPQREPAQFALAFIGENVCMACVAHMMRTQPEWVLINNGSSFVPLLPWSRRETMAPVKAIVLSQDEADLVQNALALMFTSMTQAKYGEHTQPVIGLALDAYHEPDHVAELSYRIAKTQLTELPMNNTRHDTGTGDAAGAVEKSTQQSAPPPTPIVTPRPRVIPESERNFPTDRSTEPPMPPGWTYGIAQPGENDTTTGEENPE